MLKDNPNARRSPKRTYGTGPCCREMVLAILNASYELRCKGAMPELENTYSDLETGTSYFARPDFSSREIEVTIMPQGQPHYTEWFRIDDVVLWGPLPAAFSH